MMGFSSPGLATAALAASFLLLGTGVGVAQLRLQLAETNGRLQALQEARLEDNRRSREDKRLLLDRLEEHHRLLVEEFSPRRPVSAAGRSIVTGEGQNSYEEDENASAGVGATDAFTAAAAGRRLGRGLLSGDENVASVTSVSSIEVATPLLCAAAVETFALKVNGTNLVDYLNIEFDEVKRMLFLLVGSLTKFPTMSPTPLPTVEPSLQPTPRPTLQPTRIEPQAYWNFDADASVTLPVGTGITASYNGGSRVVGSPCMAGFSNCYFFSNNDANRIDLSSPVTFGATVTIMFWFNLDSACYNNQIVIIQDTGNYMGDMIHSESIYLGGQMYLGPTSTCVNHHGNWHHHAIVNDGSSIKVYNDGVYVVPSSYSYGSFSGFNLLHIANTAGWGTNGFNGYLDDIVILPTAFSAEDVLAVFNKGLTGSPFRAV